MPSETDRHSLLTLQSSGNVVLGVVGGTDPQTERVRRDVHHPLFVKDVGTADVGRDVSSDGVTLACTPITDNDNNNISPVFTAKTKGKQAGERERD